MGDAAIHAVTARDATPADELMATLRLLPGVYRCEQTADGNIRWTFHEGPLAEDLHLTTRDVAGKPLKAFLPAAVAARIQTELAFVFDGQTREFSYELSGRRLRQFAQPVHDATGRVVAVIGFITLAVPGDAVEANIRASYDRIARDITEVAAANRQIMDANRELEAFGFMVAHELKTPLRLLEATFAGLLDLPPGRVGPEVSEGVNRGQRAVARMAQIIEDLLQLSRADMSPLELQELDLASLAGPIVEGLAWNEPDRTVEVEMRPGARVWADPRLMQIVLGNLLGNAWKFTRRQAHGHIALGWEMKGSERVFHIRDNGAGFDPARRDRLFHAFQRLHAQSEFEGTGVGLSSVQRIIRRHGGRIWAEGAVGKGASFYFTLPDRPHPPAAA